MYKVKITLPAAITNIGPSLDSLGLAVSLYTTVEFSSRSDEQIIVEIDGEGAGQYGLGLRHPAVLAMMRIFQQQERAILGIHIKITNRIPIRAGLGAESAFWVAGTIAASNMLGQVQNRAHIIEAAARLSPSAPAVVTCILGGLTTTLLDGSQLHYRAIPTQSYSVVIVVPDLPNYSLEAARLTPERVAIQDATQNLRRVPLLTEALRQGDLKLLGAVLDDRLRLPYLKPLIPGCDQAIDVARRAGAVGVSLSGAGPALVAFSAENHRTIATAMELAFENVGIRARSWVVPVDTQGVVISVAGSA